MDLKKIFEKRISKVPKVRSINGVFIAKDDSLEDTNYKPSYQRNYVWDDEKATYFIESIFLGTEIPPIILFKSEQEDGFINYEVIDGRQRYQSILRFISNELRLKKSGLQRLCDLDEFVGKTFSELEEKYQNLFKETKIRIIEYSFITEYSHEEEDVVKREIFQRYNSGITPLKSFEIDKAQYYYNDLNKWLKALFNDDVFSSKVTRVFRWEKMNIDQKVAKFRELLVLHRIPIKYYANKKQTVISKYFEYISTQIEADEELFYSLNNKIDNLVEIEKKMLEEGVAYNRLYAECLFWAFSVMEQNEVEYSLKDCDVLNRLVIYLKENAEAFTTIKSSFYNVLVQRYKTTASFFEYEYNCSFDLAINNNENFKITSKLLPTNINSAEGPVLSKGFEELRINKPEPTSVELTELLDNLKSNCFILRPAYQRADVKNKKKSSSIIESMLLGIMLPPIFVFKRINGTSEVVDGQQRLLSIISFIGETYKDENGDIQKPLLSNFKLDLGDNAILNDLNGSSYNDLSKADQNKIRKTSIYIIEISEEKNKGFDPVDLFVRLNNKPYPIARDSFEMWNSFASRDIVESIKSAVKNNEKWFYFRKNNNRMDNENLYATLAYFQYMYRVNGYGQNSIVPDRTIETFVVDKRLACRFRFRNDITKLMYKKFDSRFIDAINYIEFNFVSNLKKILTTVKTNVSISKELDTLLKVENGKRTQMSFYILWLLLHDIPSSVLIDKCEEVKREIFDILTMTDSCASVESFIVKAKNFRLKYLSDNVCVCVKICDIASVLTTSIECDGEAENLIVLFKRPRIDNRFDVKVGNIAKFMSDELCLRLYRPGFMQRYVEAYLRSRLFYYSYKKANSRLHFVMNSFETLPLIPLEKQKVFVKVLDYIDASVPMVKSYFERLLDLMFYECYYSSEFTDASVDIIDVLKESPSLDNLSEEEKQGKVKEIYTEQTTHNSIIGMYLMKAVDIDVVKSVEQSLIYEENNSNKN